MAKTPPRGNEKYLGGLWIIEASGLDVALKLATEGSMACNRKVEVRRYAAKAAGRAYGRLGRSQESRAAYDKAIERTGNTAGTAYLTRRRDQLG